MPAFAREFVCSAVGNFGFRGLKHELQSVVDFRKLVAHEVSFGFHAGIECLPLPASAAGDYSVQSVDGDLFKPVCEFRCVGDR